jgi:malate dehydrogenase (oxaloacetate-decarboxylating)(NADP+)
MMSSRVSTERAECTAEEAYRWSNGQALYAAGSPLPPVRFGDKIFIPGQANNLYILPAIGLAAYAPRAKRVTDEMLPAVARGLAEQVTQAELDAGLLYSPLTNILETEIKNAVRVCEVIFERGLA